jgi:hypothetical protein
MQLTESKIVSWGWHLEPLVKTGQLCTFINNWKLCGQ